MAGFDKLVTRRKLLQAAGAGAGLIVAAACQPKVIEVEKVVEVEKAVTVEIEKEVEKVVIQTVEVVKAPDIQIQGSFWVLQKQDFFPDMNDWWRQELTRFCKEQGWPLDVSYEAGYTAGSPFQEKLAAAAAAGTPADLLMHDSGITNLRRLSVLDPVSDIVEECIERWGNPSPRAELDYTMDGQWWAVPYFARSDGGWFLRSVFEAKGIDIQKIRLYTDLWEACLEVSDPANELYGWGVTINASNDGNWFRNRVTHGWGAYIQDETGDYVTIDSEEMVEAMTWMTRIYMEEKWEPMLPPGVLAWTDPTNNEVFLAGKLAYTQNGGTMYGKAILDGNPIVPDVGFHPPAGGPVNLEFNSLGSNNMMLFKGARNPEAARETMRHFLLSVESMDGIFSNAPAFALPVYERLWDESKYIPTNQTAMEQKPVAMSPQGTILPGTYPGPAHNPAMAAADSARILNDMVSDILRGTPVADAVKTCHERYVAIFKEFGLPGERE
ncbi:MAG TPA: extracellular solute-binding protein [Chloroflexi bacterium]|jgi:multiple sugar transport system substrate-binding protein|nr:extracellular solute-binding protein [Chloroflexota bacterium]